MEGKENGLGGGRGRGEEREKGADWMEERREESNGGVVA